MLLLFLGLGDLRVTTLSAAGVDPLAFVREGESDEVDVDAETGCF